MTANSELTEIIRSVTGSWDEPLDEVHDIPQIVNAILAAGYTKTQKDKLADAWDAGGKAAIEREHTYGAEAKAKFSNPYREDADS